ncbi:MAG: glutaminyl-peptide cyclotransferase [Sphingomonas sp.]|uniref:glutaminyl-peptide cyclotransferase n=1 Tax=Sphingomonas sp. TaxID=28214 RepID=UPI001ACF0BE3|nr:glutaminyl-peptide cyclotransferase [Sphingomonas sp.]MBN8807909.1 glutaminyl-peptide cyclotransferase [Sphingomonas sp.]
MRFRSGRIALFALLLAGPAVAQEIPALDPSSVPVRPAEVVATFPHDPHAYTEGLFYQDGALWESTGTIGRSGIRKVDLKTGKVLMSVAVDPPLYGEGIAPWGDQILSLTWKNGIGFRWSKDKLKQLGSFRYTGEGWALTNDGRDVILSDGTPVLRFIDPATFKVRRRLTVTHDGRPLPNLNEIEYVDGEILANVWLTDRIARIDPTSGRVVGWIDVSELHRQSGATDINDVANGIAWDAKHRRLFVTGKDWPYLFQIKPPKEAARQ